MVKKLAVYPHHQVQTNIDKLLNMSRDGQKSTASTPPPTIDIAPVSNSNSRPGLGPTVRSPSNPLTTERNDQNAPSPISENNLNRRVKDGSAPLSSLLGISQAHPHTQYSGKRYLISLLKNLLFIS